MQGGTKKEQFNKPLILAIDVETWERERKREREREREADVENCNKRGIPYHMFQDHDPIC